MSPIQEEQGRRFGGSFSQGILRLKVDWVLQKKKQLETADPYSTGAHTISGRANYR